MADKRTIILITESTRTSWLRDASTYALFLALVGTGWLLDSQAMQWVGAAIGFITICTQSHKDSRKFSIKDARAELDRLESKSP